MSDAEVATDSGERSEEVRIRSGDVTLAGTFVAPQSTRGAALVLTGSGPLDRDSNTRALRLEINPAIAATLGSVGVASLRYDKRGAGSSGGDFLTTSLTDNFDDARAALGWLSERCPDVPRFVIGHSEGALHAAHLAADVTGLAGVVLIGCPARRGEDVLTWQAARIIPTLPPVVRGLLRVLHKDPAVSQQKVFATLRSTTAATVRVQGKRLNAAWLREFLDSDPSPFLRRIAVPVLVITGDHDMQVPPDDAVAIAGLVPGECEVHRVANLSHLLRPDPESLGPRHYRKSVTQPVDPQVTDLIARWIVDHLAGAGSPEVAHPD
jgi:uncharacterized protein